MVDRAEMELINEIEYFAKKGEGYVPEENEDLVDLIQITNKKKYWDKLYYKTENLVHNIFHKKVNNYYKMNIKEDIYQILYTGWTKAVKSYNRKKATGKFHAFAYFIINQNYVQFASRITETKVGSSVKHQLMNDVTINKDSCKEKNTEGVVASIMRDDSTLDEMNQFEVSEYIEDKLNILKKKDSFLYKLIKEHIFKQKTQKDLCKKYKMNATTMSRKIKTAYEYLRNLINPEDVYFTKCAY